MRNDSARMSGQIREEEFDEEHRRAYEMRSTNALGALRARVRPARLSMYDNDR